MAFSILRFLHIVENFSDEADELLLSNAQWVKSMFQKYTGCLYFLSLTLIGMSYEKCSS